MSFVSVEFAVLLSVLLLSLWLVKPHLWRKILLLVVSCVFYAYWDWRFLGLLGLVTVVDYYIASALYRSNVEQHRRVLLACSIVMNLGLLFVFKYFNFFIANLNTVGAVLGLHIATWSIILPIGISFYIFETLSYVIDVYRRATPPARSILDYAIFITFFPRLVAGPIMRGQQFLPQLEHGLRLTPENLVAGSQIFIRGLLKKLVVADHLALFVDTVYAAPHVFAPSTVWLAIGAYSAQILCDFSGYTDMAVGLGRMLGIALPKNFDLPYTAQSLTEFWQRWHISLSTWLRDYLYVPLGGNRRGPARTLFNLLLTMLLGGLWHGASWNFVVWGGLHGTYLAIERLLRGGGTRAAAAPWTEARAWLRAAGVFMIVSLTWVFFRSPSVETTFAIWRKLLFLDNGGIAWPFTAAVLAVPAMVLGGFLVRRCGISFPVVSRNSPLLPAALALGVLLVYLFAALNVSPFIYFQF
jgi:alginate O-acetyltransferase complex protein AlgI